VFVLVVNDDSKFFVSDAHKDFVVVVVKKHIKHTNTNLLDNYLSHDDTIKLSMYNI
jgi:DNA-directed RNA polymerase subunit L